MRGYDLTMGRPPSPIPPRPLPRRARRKNRGGVRIQTIDSSTRPAASDRACRDSRAADGAAGRSRWLRLHWARASSLPVRCTSTRRPLRSAIRPLLPAGLNGFLPRGASVSSARIRRSLARHRPVEIRPRQSGDLLAELVAQHPGLDLLDLAFGEVRPIGTDHRTPGSAGSLRDRDAPSRCGLRGSCLRGSQTPARHWRPGRAPASHRSGRI